MTLENLRVRIDALDASIMQLLNERFALMAAVKEAKQKEGIATFDPTREQAILQKVTHFEYAHQLHALYELLFELSKALQR